MAAIELIGRILPPGTKVNLPPFARIAAAPPGKPELGFVIKIQNSIVNVVCDGATVTNEAFMDAYLCALESVRPIVNLYGLHQGLCLTVVFERFVGTDGATKEISLGDPALKGVFTAYDAIADLYSVTALAFADGNLRMALHDLSAAIAHPNDTAINCGRVVEAIRKMIAGQGHTEKHWEQMRTALNIDRLFLLRITGHANEPRHGNYVYMPGDLTQELSIQTCKVMNRYLEYRLRGSLPLTDPDFPRLTA